MTSPAAILRVLVEANTKKASRALLRFDAAMRATEAGLPQKEVLVGEYGPELLFAPEDCGCKKGEAA
jgi:hypothetical protein